MTGRGKVSVYLHGGKCLTFSHGSVISEYEIDTGNYHIFFDKHSTRKIIKSLKNIKDDIIRLEAIEIIENELKKLKYKGANRDSCDS